METIITMYKTKKKPTTEVDFEWPQDAEPVDYGYYITPILQEFLQNLSKRKNGKCEFSRILITEDDLLELNCFLTDLSFFGEARDEDITERDLYHKYCAGIDKDIEAAESVINNGGYVFYQLS